MLDCAGLKCWHLPFKFTSLSSSLLLSLSLSAGSDYSHLDMVLTFVPSAATQQQQCALVMVVNDVRFEEDETFSVALSVDASVTVSYHISRTLITILDDDNVTLAITTPSTHVAEGNGSIDACVELSGDTERNISYALRLQDIDGNDHHFNIRWFCVFHVLFFLLQL